jgi:thioesterase domain-containing protein
VKIRSYRIELGEVAAALSEHPAIQQAVVTVREDRPSVKRLVAYVIPATDVPPAATAEIQEFLRARLPVHMVPHQYVTLEQFPLTAGGKIDRGALPPPVNGDPAARFVAPSTPREETLAAIWVDVLRVERVGVHDNFFELGGDSLLGLQMIARARKSGIVLVPKQLFLHQTIAELALTAATSTEDDAGAESCLVPIQIGGERRPLFCIHPGGGTVFCYLELARHLPNDQPVYGLQAQGIDGLLAPHGSVKEMACHYVELIRTIQPHGPYQLCGWSSGGIIAYEMARLLEAQGVAIGRLLLIDTGLPTPGNELGEDDLNSVLLAMFPGESQERIERMRQLPPEEQLAYFREQAERAQQVVAGIDDTFLHYAYEVFKAGAQAMLQYRPASFSGKVVLVRGNPDATPLHKDPLLGWGAWVDGGVEVRPIAGDHITMLQSPTVERLAAIIESYLA